MCTVSYLPLKSGGYIMTSNRDEAPGRNAIDLRHETHGDHELIYPVDPGAGGSWFCISNHDRVACLLNGAYHPFIPDPKYTYSRGKVLLDLALSVSVEDFLKRHDLSKTAPFTTAIASANTLHELIWDGTKPYVTELDPGKTAFWSSVTLYPEPVRLWRKSLFEHWAALRKDFDQDSIMHFHQYGSKDDPWNGFVMNREERVKTLSITSALRDAHSILIQHTDLAGGISYSETLNLHTTHVDNA
jgi:hypothetical protein